MTAKQVVAESNICDECSKHICDMCGCEIDSKNASESENESDYEEELIKEQMRNVVKALSSTSLKGGNKHEVEEDVEKVEAKKEEFGNVLGGRKTKGGRYGRRNLLSDRPLLDTLSVGHLGAHIGRVNRDSERLLLCRHN